MKTRVILWENSWEKRGETILTKTRVVHPKKWKQLITHCDVTANLSRCKVASIILEIILSEVGTVTYCYVKFYKSCRSVTLSGIIKTIFSSFPHKREQALRRDFHRLVS